MYNFTFFFVNRDHIIMSVLFINFLRIYYSVKFFFFLYIVLVGVVLRLVTETDWFNDRDNGLGGSPGTYCFELRTGEPDLE